jgi:hypothetical protein
MNDQGTTEKETNAATKQVVKDKMRSDITIACMPFHIIGDVVGSSTQRLPKRAIKRDTGRKKCQERQAPCTPTFSSRHPYFLLNLHYTVSHLKFINVRIQ